MKSITMKKTPFTLVSITMVSGPIKKQWVFVTIDHYLALKISMLFIVGLMKTGKTNNNL
jgi:hypothetical protein